MLSAHKPYENYPQLIRQICAKQQANAQVASGVPAMCDGVTQGREGMELSLFSRDIIAMATTVGLSHEMFDGAILLGICDKIVPGLLIGALQTGHLPALFIPAGPMTTGISNQEKKNIRQQFLNKEVGRSELLQSEMAAYHDIGTCTFYGTANSNQMLLEAMGLHRPNHAFVNPRDTLRPVLVEDCVNQLIHNVQHVGLGIGEMLNAASFVNAIVALLATAGSTNHTIHWIAVAKAAGFKITWEDMAKLSAVVPQIAKIYPNGPKDVNDFQRAGGPALALHYLLDAGLLLEEVHTVNGFGLSKQCQTPLTTQGANLSYQTVSDSADWDVLRPCSKPFRPSGGISVVSGNLGQAIVKTSTIAEDDCHIKAPAKIFDSQQALLEAFEGGILNQPFVALMRNQGPSQNGMPELHKVVSILTAIRNKGIQVALLTDGRLSGASGDVLCAIHLVPEKSCQ